MSLSGVCVDRGRLVKRESTAVRVEGSTSFASVAGSWFKCRLFLGASNDVPDPTNAHFSSVNQPQVLCVRKDLDGVQLDVHGDEMMDIKSVQLGRAIWRVLGEPEPIRKKRPLIGFLVNVERVIEHDFDDLLNQNVPVLYP